MNSEVDAFFELLRAGLWGNGNPDIRIDGATDWQEVYQLAQEQSVQGLVLQGIEWFKSHNLNPDRDLNIPKVLLLQWIGEVQAIEQRNKEMNAFIADLIEKLRKNDIYTILVKGQGIAQCYVRPQWRPCGDVDLLLSDNNLCAAKSYLSPLASHVDKEEPYEQHTAMTIDSWMVELHGSLRTGVTSKIDKGIEDLQHSVFYGGNVRSWLNGNTQVFLPSADTDVLLIFTHILKHFFRNGIGLRQICDWCRLLWTFKDSLNRDLLESRIQKMGIMTEWKAFANLAVNHLGMPVEAMPLYSDDKKWGRKTDNILDYIFEVGNFGHNRNNSYSNKYPPIIRKLISFGRHNRDSVRYFPIFPLDTVKSWLHMIKFGFRDLKD